MLFIKSFDFESLKNSNNRFHVLSNVSSFAWNEKFKEENTIFENSFCQSDVKFNMFLSPIFTNGSTTSLFLV